MKVSVIMPCYNSEMYLDRAIGSVVSQEVPDWLDWEFIIVDDLSTDGSWERIKSWASKYPQTFVIHQVRVHTGHPALPRNIGLEMVTGDLIAYIDSDNEWLPGHMEIMASYLRDNPECKAVYCDREQVELDGATITFSHPWNIPRLRVRNYVDMGDLMHRKECTDLIGGFEEAYVWTEDWGLMLKFADRFGDQIHHLPVPLHRYYVTGDNRTLKQSRVPKTVERKLGVVLAIPTLGMVSMHFTIALIALGNPINTHVQFRGLKGKEVGHARNVLARQAAFDLGADYVFFVDDDVIIPSDALNRLLSHQKDICAGVYYSKSPVPDPLIFTTIGGGAYRDWNVGEFIGDDIRITGVGMGCTLIKTDVFRKVSEPWFETSKRLAIEDGVLTKYSSTEDIPFCEKAVEAGFRIYVDTAVQCKHYDKKNDSMIGWNGERVVVEELTT